MSNNVWGFILVLFIMANSVVNHNIIDKTTQKLFQNQSKVVYVTAVNRDKTMSTTSFNAMVSDVKKNLEKAGYPNVIVVPQPDNEDNVVILSFDPPKQSESKK